MQLIEEMNEWLTLLWVGCFCVRGGSQWRINGYMKEGCQGPAGGQQQQIWIIISAERQTDRLVLNSPPRAKRVMEEVCVRDCAGLLVCSPNGGSPNP